VLAHAQKMMPPSSNCMIDTTISDSNPYLTRPWILGLYDQCAFVLHLDHTTGTPDLFE